MTRFCRGELAQPFLSDRLLGISKNEIRGLDTCINIHLATQLTQNIPGRIQESDYPIAGWIRELPGVQKKCVIRYPANSPIRVQCLRQSTYDIVGADAFGALDRRLSAGT